MYCTKCDGDFHLCSDLHLHYEYLENLPMVVGGVTSYRVNGTQELQPLSLQTYTKLSNNCRSLSKVVRTLARSNFMKEILDDMPTKPNTSMMVKSVVMLQPSMITKLRSFVPSEENLKDAFYQLIKSSQMHYKPSSKQFLPTKLANGLTVASLRYDQKSAEEVLGIRYLPILSFKDKKLFHLLFLNCHQLHTGPFTIHLNP